MPWSATIRPTSIRSGRPGKTSRPGSIVACGASASGSSNFTYRNVDAEVADAVRGAADKLASLGADVKPVRIPLFENKINFSYPLTILLYEFNQILGNEYRTADKSLFGPVVQANMARGSQIPKATYDTAIA